MDIQQSFEMLVVDKTSFKYKAAKLSLVVWVGRVPRQAKDLWNWNLSLKLVLLGTFRRIFKAPGTVHFIKLECYCVSITWYFFFFLIIK